MGLALSLLLLVGDARAQTLRFAGRDWLIEAGDCQAGNVCAKENAWVDGEGLHLRLSTAAAGGYHAAAIESADFTRYGIHRFYIRGPVASLDKNVVLGLFTFKDRPDLRDNNFIDADLIDLGEGEIDIELSRWKDPAGGAPNLYYTVQEGPPPAPALNVSSTSFTLADCSGLDCYSTHEFDWEPDHIRFKSFRGHSPEIAGEPGLLIHEWTYPEPGQKPRAIPREMLPKIYINLYRADADDDSPGQEVEIIVSAADLPIERIPTLSSGAARASLAGLEFSVHYADQDGDAPSLKGVNVDGRDFDLALYAGAPSSGTYKATPALSTSAAHGYYFFFDDGHGGAARLPETGVFTWKAGERSR